MQQNTLPCKSGFSENTMMLSDLPLGGRLLIRSRTNWRVGVIASIAVDVITISVASPKGRNYKIRRDPQNSIAITKGFCFLGEGKVEEWTENFAIYDPRW